MIKILPNNFSKKLFDHYALNPLQSWLWGEARKKMGIEILRLGEYKNNQLKNVFQISLHQIPFTSIKIGYLPRSTFPSKEVLEFLYHYGEKKGLLFIKIEPYLKKAPDRQNLPVNLQPSPHPLFPKWTITLDLTKDKENLLRNMHHKTRYNIRLAKKKGVIVKEESNQEGFEIFSKLYFQTCQRQRYYGHNYNYHKILWETLKNKIAHILIAYYKNIPLAAYQLFLFKDILYYPYGGSSLQYRNYMANNLLMWEAILFGKRKKAKVFDMWGALSPDYDKTHPWAGFTRFKQGYGGQFTQFVGSYDLIINPFGYRIYNLLYKIRKLYLKILSKRIII